MCKFGICASCWCNLIFSNEVFNSSRGLGVVQLLLKIFSFLVLSTNFIYNNHFVRFMRYPVFKCMFMYTRCVLYMCTHVCACLCYSEKYNQTQLGNSTDM